MHFQHVPEFGVFFRDGHGDANARANEERLMERWADEAKIIGCFAAPIKASPDERMAHDSRARSLPYYTIRGATMRIRIAKPYLISTLIEAREQNWQVRTYSHLVHMPQTPPNLTVLATLAWLKAIDNRTMQQFRDSLSTIMDDSSVTMLTRDLNLCEGRNMTCSNINCSFDCTKKSPHWTSARCLKVVFGHQFPPTEWGDVRPRTVLAKCVIKKQCVKCYREDHSSNRVFIL